MRCAAVELDFTGCDPQPAHRHSVLGQRAGLVGKDDRGRAQRFDRRQPLDQRVLPRHAPHAARERERRDDRQALGDGGDRERDGRFDDEENAVAGAQADADDDDGQDEGRPHQLPGQPRQFLFQRRTAGFGLFDELRDAAKLGVEAGRRDHADAAAARHRRALEQHRAALSQARVDGDGVDLLVNGGGFAGQRRFIGGEIGALDEPQIGGNGIAGIQQHNVAGHQFLSRDQACVAVAADAGRTAAERAQRLDRSRRLQFGDKADQRVDGEHGDDGGAFFQFAEREGEPGGACQQEHHRADELVCEHHQRADLAA